MDACRFVNEVYLCCEGGEWLEESLSQEQLRDDESVSDADVPIGSAKPVRVDKAA